MSISLLHISDDGKNSKGASISWFLKIVCTSSYQPCAVNHSIARVGYARKSIIIIPSARPHVGNGDGLDLESHFDEKDPDDDV